MKQHRAASTPVGRVGPEVIAAGLGTLDGLATRWSTSMSHYIGTLAAGRSDQTQPAVPQPPRPVLNSPPVMQAHGGIIVET